MGVASTITRRHTLPENSLIIWLLHLTASFFYNIPWALGVAVAMYPLELGPAALRFDYCGFMQWLLFKEKFPSQRNGYQDKWLATHDLDKDNTDITKWTGEEHGVLTLLRELQETSDSREWDNSLLQARAWLLVI